MTPFSYAWTLQYSRGNAGSEVKGHQKLGDRDCNPMFRFEDSGGQEKLT